VRLSVAPIRYGAGQKGKVVTSLLYGIPVVATPIAAEGMHLREGEHFLCAETPEAFAKAVLRLLEDDRLWHALSGEGRARAAEKFGYERVFAGLREVLVALGLPLPPGPQAIPSGRRARKTAGAPVQIGTASR
jgi:glycosyltransferase involved in cell wall biosynthesis